MKLLFTLVGVSLILSILILLVPAPDSSVSPLVQIEPDPDDIHWHARLRLLVNGQEIPVASGIGLNPLRSLHTHESNGIIHIEVPNENPNHRLLETFFDIWGVSFSKECLFQYCTGVQMTINGNSTEEFEQYAMQNEDLIVLSVIV